MKVVKEYFEQWTGEMNPTQVGMDWSPDITFTFAEINDENAIDSRSENSVNVDAKDYLNNSKIKWW